MYKPLEEKAQLKATKSKLKKQAKIKKFREAQMGKAVESFNDSAQADDINND